MGFNPDAAAQFTNNFLSTYLAKAEQRRADKRMMIQSLLQDPEAAISVFGDKELGRVTDVGKLRNTLAEQKAAAEQAKKDNASVEFNRKLQLMRAKELMKAPKQISTAADKKATEEQKKKDAELKIQLEAIDKEINRVVAAQQFAEKTYGKRDPNLDARLQDLTATRNRLSGADVAMQQTQDIAIGEKSLDAVTQAIIDSLGFNTPEATGMPTTEVPTALPGASMISQLPQQNINMSKYPAPIGVDFGDYADFLATIDDPAKYSKQKLHELYFGYLADQNRITQGKLNELQLANYQTPDEKRMADTAASVRTAQIKEQTIAQPKEERLEKKKALASGRAILPRIGEVKKGQPGTTREDYYTYSDVYSIFKPLVDSGMLTSEEVKPIIDEALRETERADKAIDKKIQAAKKKTQGKPQKKSNSGSAASAIAIEGNKKGKKK